MFEEEEEESPAKRSAPLFYFKFEMRLEFIPFIEQEIKEFIVFSESQLNKIEQIPKILIILNKRIKDIDRFYDENWNDYRTQQILRSRQFLVEFCKRNHSKISQSTSIKKINAESSPIKLQQKSPLVSKEIKKEPKQSDQVNKIRQSPIINNNEILSIERLKHSTSKSFSKDKPKINAIQNKASPFATSPVLESSFIPNKNSLSRGKNVESPVRYPKKIESPVQKKVAPRKLTKQEYINYLRNKK